MQTMTPARIRQLHLQLDPGGMLNAAFDLKNQILQILEESKSWKVPEFSPENILLSGIGGSAIGGELLKSITEKDLKVPAVTCRDYEIPGFVNEKTLCICSSYSGNTEETITTYQLCRERNATMVVVSTGGKLAEMAEKDGVAFCPIPKGYQPRAALGLSLTAQIAVLTKMGIIGDYSDELKSAAVLLGRLSDSWKNWQELPENPPLKLALDIYGHTPVMYGSGGYLGTMAYRWKCQFNENSKMFASWGVLPEINHNEIVGWCGQQQFYNDKFVIFLRDQNNPQRIKTRLDLTREIISKVAGTAEVYPQGNNLIEKVFYYILFGDLLTIYLAYLDTKDPSDIQIINWLKTELARARIEPGNN
ncbi:MAG: bifunctional phosphoglucose/phosphomannose isomerase [Firmicutes bacterium]|nr:bifunctional phosphoglucose/phosphomannose isomerase [Bacillota bacterium]